MHAARDRRVDFGRAAAVEPVLVRQVRSDLAGCVRSVALGATQREERPALLHVLGRGGDCEDTLVRDLVGHDRCACRVDAELAHLRFVGLLVEEAGSQVKEECVKQRPDHRAVESSPSTRSRQRPD